MTAPAPARVPMSNGRLYYSARGMHEFQADAACEAVLRRNMVGVLDVGLGKQAPVSEPVLTPTGWRTMGEIRPGDHVISGSDGLPARVLSIHPQLDRTTYRVTFSDGSWTRCGPDHLWTVDSRTRGRRPAPRRTMTTAALLDEGLRDAGGQRRWWVPQCAPVQYPARELPVDPYVLGVLLGDGYLHRSGSAHITTDKEILGEIAPDATLGHHESVGIAVLNTTRWSVGLSDLGLAGTHSATKFVPEMYLRAAEPDRRALLSGLLDTDGHPMADGGIEYTSTSERLVQAVAELAESLGGVVRQQGTSRVTSYTHKGEQREGQRSWRINVKLVDNPFRLARKKIRWVEPSKYVPRRFIDSIEPDEPEDSVCIKIDRADGLYLTRFHIVTHNTHIAMATAAMLYELDEIDLVMHVARRNKIKPTEFPADWAEYTALSTVVYHGQGRQKRLTKALATGPVDVVVTTYETGAHELMTRVKKSARGRGSKTDGPLVEALGLRGKRVLWIFDEVLRLGNRSNELWQSYDYVLTQLRRGPHAQRVLGLTATPKSTDEEQAYNIALIVAPDQFPPITVFEEQFTKGRDDYGRYIWQPGKRKEFAPLFQQIVYRKRATDPDVVAQMPRLVEKLVEVELNPLHRELYNSVAEMLGDPAELEPEQEDVLNMALRLTAGHPAAHLHSGSQLSQQIVDALGEAGLRAIPSSKSRALVELLQELLAAEHQVIVFTFYAETVLPELARDLLGAGIEVATYTGAGAGRSNEQAKADFKAGRARVLLSSDAGAEGLNLPEATYIIEYESASTFERRTQRFGRHTRINSDKRTVYGLTLLAEHTREENTLNSVLIRDARLDQLLGDRGADGHLDARDRRRLLGRAQS